MKPILFKFFGINIYGYGTMIAIGILAAILLINYRAEKQGYDEDSILNMAIIAIIGGVIGGKLLYIITDIKNIIADPSLLKDFGSGFVIYGSIIGGVIGVYIYSRRKKWRLLKIFDLVIPSVALAQGFGRIGCFLAGCCYGRATTSPFGVKFREGSLAPADACLLPTQIYSSIFDFALAAFLLWYSKKEKSEGRVFSMYLILYSIGRFAVEFLRDDPRGSVGPLSTSQFISIFTFILGIVIFNIHRLKEGHTKKEAMKD
ncbi:prolipoprotein diacylglyceryl transferase [Clostridium omnivorum]|uniref:Phosphatidylglycerol--prolipoprotein diacylglyceryl transferase n=1 Tax=Clostridium omnivorum TaxID=1604902 RepID=A0ABQ5N7D5_9CLOT|nr:prolipoprotein diacylglyceryl transferase [Clostridium sp. E14]GLC30999.1 prolipoprotein diacylglyceryl transferase [Clostridium sp. E14]